MVRELHGGMPELPCSRGKVDGLQSRKRIGIVLCGCGWLLTWAHTDDLFKV